MNDSVIKSQKVALLGLVNQASSIGIIVGENQSLDKMAASLGLYLSLSQAGKSVSIASKKDPIVELSNLVGIDQIKKEFSGDAKKLIVSLPYKEGEVEKVSYNIEGNRLNINLFAAKNASITFDAQEVEYIKNGATPSLIFAVGLRAANEVTSIVSDSSTLKIVVIDALQNPDFGDIVLFDSSFSSVSEVVVQLLKELSLPLDQDIAQNLLDGIIFATNNFTSGNTSAWAFEAAGMLLKKGARRRGQNQNRQGRQNSLQQLPNMRTGRGSVSFQSNDKRQQPLKQVFPQPQVQSQAVPQQEILQTSQLDTTDEIDEEKGDRVPSDWFVPKVFKSSRQNQGS